MNRNVSGKKVTAKEIAVTGIMSAVAFVFMVLEFGVPIVPSFLKFDFSDLPALITSFALGPVFGVCVELIKNLLHLLFTHTGGVGELANFLVGTALVFPAGLIYKHRKTRKNALIGVLAGAVLSTAISFPVNYFITYPFYAKLMPMDAILDAYKLILPAADTLPKALLIFNCPFTFVKGVLNACITFAVYKHLSPILKAK